MFIKILLKYILGYVRITVEGYYIERFINICTTSKILIWNLKREKGVRLYLNIGIKDFFEAVKIAKKLKCKVKITQKRFLRFGRNDTYLVILSAVEGSCLVILYLFTNQFNLVTAIDQSLVTKMQRREGR